MRFTQVPLLALLATMATARFESIECGSGDGYVSGLGGYDEYNVAKYMKDLRNNGVCTVGAGVGTCIRVSCGNTSGVWMCNDTDEEQSVDCAVIADYVNYDDGMGIESLPEYNAPNTIMGQCGCGQYSCNVNAGQIHDDQGFSVVAAQANCNIDVNLDPTQQIV